MKKHYGEYSSDLSPHCEFDPNAFIGNEDVPQDLCNFVLALCLAYNDFRFYMISYDMLLKSEPQNLKERSSVTGEYAGIKFHLIRLHVAFAHELMELIEVNSKLLEHVFFKEIIKHLPGKARDSWKMIVDAAITGEEVKKTSNLLARIRHKIVAHYDQEELSVGYKKGFFEDGSILEYACISLGNSLKEARFYFADRAIQGYIEKGLNADVESFFKSLEQIMCDINMALYNICITFIQRRGFAWRKPASNK